MKVFKFIFIASVTILVSQGLKITHMEGTYDLDGDGFQEFASVEERLSGNKKSSVIRYYELDDDGYQKMEWELEAPDGLLGNFVNVYALDFLWGGFPSLFQIIFFFGVFLLIPNICRRLNDLAVSRLAFLLLFVPIVNILFELYLVFMPGKKNK